MRAEGAAREPGSAAAAGRRRRRGRRPRAAARTRAAPSRSTSGPPGRAASAARAAGSAPAAPLLQRGAEEARRAAAAGLGSGIGRIGSGFWHSRSPTPPCREDPAEPCGDDSEREVEGDQPGRDVGQGRRRWPRTRRRRSGAGRSRRSGRRPRPTAPRASDQRPSPNRTATRIARQAMKAVTRARRLVGEERGQQVDGQHRGDPGEALLEGAGRGSGRGGPGSRRSRRWRAPTVRMKKSGLPQIVGKPPTSR